MSTHAIERTSPRGEGTTFIGTCWKCGRTGLTLADGMKECDNPSGMTEDESFRIALEGPEADEAEDSWLNVELRNGALSCATEEPKGEA